MATTSLSVSDELLSTTAFARLKEMRSMNDRPAPFVDDLLKLGTREESGGERIIIPWKTNRHSKTTQLSTGYEPVNLHAEPLGTPGHDSWAYCIRPVLISSKDEILNRDSHKVISIMESRLKDVEDGMRLEFQDQILRGGEANMSDFNTLNGTTGATTANTGILEIEDVGNQNNTVHNVSKNTHSSLPGFQNQVYDADNDFSTNGLTGLYDLTTRIRELAGDAVNLRGYLSIAGANNLKTQLQSQEQYLVRGDNQLDGGRAVMSYNGIPLTVTSRMPDTTVNGGDNEWTCLFLDWNAIKFVGQRGYVFKLDEFKSVSGHSVRCAFMHLFGQLTCEYWGSNGLLYDADTI